MANYLAEFCKEVQIISYLGKKEYLNFINKNLNKRVKFDYIIKKDSSTIIKKDFMIYEIEKTIWKLFSK